MKPLLGDLVQRRVSVIAVPGSTPVSLAAKAAIADIPIVGVAENPVVLGLVKSLAQPDGNATGINFFNAETDAKRLGLMHELLPRATRVGVYGRSGRHSVHRRDVEIRPRGSSELRDRGHFLADEVIE